ncbi:aldo/keto reductase [Streptomyces sp. NPDC033754]|uniref:aldo/keto reductase n=1 Tax=unclassified Streptomyces TaxID=2593676 RepID=UPI0033CA1078
MTATLALGTYRVPADWMAQAAERAAVAPDPWVDTASNYCDGAAHRLLAPALAAYPRLRVATKTGYLTPAAVQAAVADGIPVPASVRHCLDPSLVRWQVDRARAELGRERIETVFVHNPEHLPDDQLAAGLRDAFAVLEEETAAGRIASYGVATWNGFTDSRFTVATLNSLARAAAGSPDHHLKTIQLPVSLVEATALAQSLLGRGPIAHAVDHGWRVHASAPLHGGELARLDGGDYLAALIRPGTILAEAALAAVASCPGIERVLVSTADPRHWDRALTALAHDPVPATTLRSVLRVLATA